MLLLSLAPANPSHRHPSVHACVQMAQLRTDAFVEGTDVMTGRPIETPPEPPAFVPKAFPSRHDRPSASSPASAKKGGAAAAIRAEAGAAAAAAPGSPGSRLRGRSSTGAYQYTSFIQKIKRWQTVASTLTQRIDKAPELGANLDDPAMVEQVLNESWGQLRVHLETMGKAAAGLVEVTAGKSGKAIDFGLVEIQTLKMLKGMKPAINAVRVAAELEDTPGLGPSLLRRAKNMCGGIQRLVGGLATRTLSAADTQTELRAAVKEMQTPINQILKNAYKGVEEAKQMALREKERAAAAERYSKEQAARREKFEAEERAREQAELAAMSAAERKARKEQMAKDAAAAIAQAQQDAESAYIERAIAKNPGLKHHFGGAEEAAADLTTSGFVESEEGMYDTGAVARAGFATDSAANSAAEDAANAKKEAYIRRLRMEQEMDREDKLRADSEEATYVAAKILQAVDEAEIDPLDVFEN